MGWNTYDFDQEQLVMNIYVFFFERAIIYEYYYDNKFVRFSNTAMANKFLVVIWISSIVVGVWVQKVKIKLLDR